MANFLATMLAGSYVPPTNVTTLMREAISEVITLIDPTETSFLDLMDGTEATSTVWQWPIDSLPAVVSSNTAGAIDIDGINMHGLVEGFDNPSFTTAYPYTGQPTRLTNFVQIFGGKVGTTDSLNRARTLVGGNPYAREQVKAMKVVKKAKERKLFDTTVANSVGRISSDPRRMHSLIYWKGQTPALQQVTASNDTSGALTGGTLKPEAIDRAVELLVNSGGRPSHLFVGTGSKFDLSGALRGQANIIGSSTYTNPAAGTPATGTSVASTPHPLNYSNIGAAEAMIIRNVDFYRTDGGRGALAIVQNYHIQETSTAVIDGGGAAWLMDMEKLAWATYVPLTHIPLAKSGYNTKGILVEEGTYELRAPNSCCIINCVTT